MGKNKGGNNSADIKEAGMTNEAPEMTNMQNAQNKSGGGKNKGGKNKGSK